MMVNICQKNLEVSSRSMKFVINSGLFNPSKTMYGFKEKERNNSGVCLKFVKHKKIA